MDFSGEEADRGVLYVEIPGERHLPPRVEPIKAQWGKPLRTFRFKAAEAWKGMEEVEAFVGWARVVLEGTPEPSLRDAFRALDNVLEVAVAEADHGPGSSAEEEVPAALEEAYARYLEEEEKDEKKRAELLRSFGELRQEVRDAAFKAGT